MLCMACLQRYGRAISNVRGQGVFYHSTYCARRGGYNALARDYGCQGAALGRNILSVNWRKIGIILTSLWWAWRSPLLSFLNAKFCSTCVNNIYGQRRFLD